MTQLNCQLIEIKVNDLSRGGSGVARLPDGQVVFIPMTLPGDLIQAKIIANKKRYIEADLVKIIEPSPDRVQPKCKVFGKCGGCEWQHIPYELQWKTKVAGAKHALTRANILIPETLFEIPAVQTWNYRNRIQLRAQGGKIGYFEKASRNLISIQDCPIARQELNDHLPLLQKKLSQQQPSQKERSQNEAQKIEIEVLPDGSVREAWNKPHGALGFRQVHDEQNLKLQERVAEWLPDGVQALDLFGGSGNFTLSEAGRLARVDCVDISSPAQPTKDTPSNYFYHKDFVRRWLLKKPPCLALSHKKYAVLDPPRAGLDQEFDPIVETLQKNGVHNILLIGCDLDSWVKDLTRFKAKNWTLGKCGWIDLFPHTHHVESLAYLSYPSN